MSRDQETLRRERARAIATILEGPHSRHESRVDQAWRRMERKTKNGKGN